MKALVTGGGALLGQGIIKSIRASHFNTHIVALDPSPYAVGLYWADSAYLVPLAKTPGYMSHIQDILAKERPDIVFVGTDVELEIFAQHRQEWESTFGTKVVVSSPEVIRIADDKWLTYQFLKSNGFPYPESCLPGDEAELVDMVGFPLVVKPRIGARSVGLHIVRNWDELRQHLTPNSVIQEHVATAEDEYTAGSLTFETCRASIVMRRTLRDGNTYQAFVDHFPELNDKVRELANSLQAFGPANFQFRLSPAGEVKVFEINARFSGTTPLRMHAGFNEVEMVMDYLLEGEAIVQQPIVQPMTILRYWEEMVVEPATIKRIEQISQ
jgi:carbamoyl-phosphate synthase large subunit